MQPRLILVTPDGRHVPTSELERRRDDIALLSEDHPARQLAVWCINNDPAGRPTAVEFHEELRKIQQSFVGAEKVRHFFIVFDMHVRELVCACVCLFV